jgi:hypothetical protein
MPESRTPRATILAQIPAARAREARERKRGRRARSASYDRRTGRVLIELTNGVLLGFPASAIPGLAPATPAQLARVTLSPGGSALRWEELDADVSIPGLLLSSIGRDEKLAELARVAGRTRSPAKAAAARANGAKGGRPRKASGR